MRRLLSVLVALVIITGLFFTVSETVIGATTPFSFFISDGLNLQYVGTDISGLSVFKSDINSVHLILNGKKDEGAIGRATVILWMGTGSDSFFAPLQPVAALVQINDLNNTIGLNLGAIATPTAVLTTIGVVNEKSIRGEWVIAPGTLAGGTDKDLVIGGLAVIGTPSAPYQANLNITINSYFPPYGSTVASSVPSPTMGNRMAAVSDYEVGLFNGYTTIFDGARPVRSFSFAQHSYIQGHLMAVHTGGDGFYVVACRDFLKGPLQLYPNPHAMTPLECTLSGTGQLAPYTGEAVYLPGNSVGETILQLYNWNLVLQ